MGLYVVVYASQVNIQQVKSYHTVADHVVLFCVAQLYGAVFIKLLYWSCNRVSLRLASPYLYGDT